MKLTKRQLRKVLRLFGWDGFDGITSVKDGWHVKANKYQLAAIEIIVKGKLT
jgi:hypothetical protein